MTDQLRCAHQCQYTEAGHIEYAKIIGHPFRATTPSPDTHLRKALRLLERGRTLEARDLLRRTLGHLPSKEATAALHVTATPRLDAAAFAEAFIRIRGAHNPTADELDGDQEVRPCAWCRLAGEQAAEALARLSESKP